MVDWAWHRRGRRLPARATTLIWGSRCRKDGAELSSRIERFAADHPDVLLARNHMGLLYVDMNRTDDARPYLTAAADRFRRVPGTHESTAIAVNNLALVHQKECRLNTAADLFKEVVESCHALNGPEHMSTALATYNLGYTHMRSGNFAVAEPLVREAIRITRLRVAPDHRYVGQFQATLGECLVELERIEEAKAVLKEAVRILSTSFPADHPRVQRVQATLNRLGG